jgi:hypothetical protein
MGGILMEQRPVSSRSLLNRVTRWNQRLHIYAGLYLLVFVWLFAVSGLVLNHPKWAFAQFWPNRRESTTELSVQLPAAATDLARARGLMEQLGLSGEVDQIKVSAGRFEFRLMTPDRITTVGVDLASSRARVQQISVNGWGVLSALHHLTGVHTDLPDLTRNSAATRLWSIAMDLASGGLLLMVLGGLYIWLQRRERLVPGLAALLLGLLACGLFLFVL